MRISDWSSDVCSSDLQESVEREDVQQESAKSAVSQLAGARLPLEAGSVVLGEDGHIQSAPANRPLAFRFAACGDRKSVVSGKSVSVRVDLGGRSIIKKKKLKSEHNKNTTQKR